MAIMSDRVVSVPSPSVHPRGPARGIDPDAGSAGDYEEPHGPPTTAPHDMGEIVHQDPGIESGIPTTRPRPLIDRIPDPVPGEPTPPLPHA